MSESTTQLLHTVSELRAARAQLEGDVAVVMTMGALHAGHVSLVELARQHARHVIVTVFVNPLQFGPHEDFDKYPRTLDADVAALEGLADIIFAPSSADMYPDGASETMVRSGRVGANFEGARRPGHFDGMLTVVLKLLQLTQPNCAIFGQKDAQQLALIRRMVADLNVPTTVVAAPILRDPDGLAMSSRNRFLSADERVAGLRLSRAVAAAQRVAGASAGYFADANSVRSVARSVLEAGDVAAGVEFVIDYAELVHPDTFEVVNAVYQGPALFVVAVRVGTTRLLDNGTLKIGGGERDTLKG